MLCFCCRPHHQVHHHKRPVRVDVTKLDYNKIDESKNKNANSSSSSSTKIPRIHSEYADSSQSDHIVIISQLTEKYASLEKQLQLKEGQLLEKEKYVSILCSVLNSLRFLVIKIIVRYEVLEGWFLVINVRKIERKLKMSSSKLSPLLINEITLITVCSNPKAVSK